MSDNHLCGLVQDKTYTYRYLENLKHEQDRRLNKKHMQPDQYTVGYMGCVGGNRDLDKFWNGPMLFFK